MILLDRDAADDRSPVLPTGPVHVNEVHLVGKLSQPVRMQELPSGDLLGKWNLVVARARRDRLPDDGESAGDPGSSAASRRRRSHDTIECFSFDLDLIERLSDLAGGARLELYGALRRRFSRDQSGQSRYGVEAITVAVLSETPATTPPPVPGDPACSGVPCDGAGSADPADPWQPVVAR